MLNNRKLGTAPLMAWILSAVTGPLSHLAGKGSPLETLAASVLCTTLSVLLYLYREKDEEKTLWYTALQIGFLSVLGGVLLRMYRGAWETDSSILPLILVGLAYFGSRNGAEQAGRAASVLMWFLLILYAAIVAGGIGNVKLSRLQISAEISSGGIWLVCLFPAVGMFLPKEKGTTKGLWFVPAFSVLISALVIGTLSQSVAQNMQSPLSAFAKSLSLFGVVERYEAFVSVALTIGYYTMISFVLSGAFHLMDRSEAGMGKWGALIAAGGVWLTSHFETKGYYWLALASLVMWHVIPCMMHKNKVEK